MLHGGAARQEAIRMIGKKFGIVVALVLTVIAAGCLFSSSTTQGTTPTASPTPEPTIVAPEAASEGANMETPDIQVGAPNENLDLGQLV